MKNKRIATVIIMILSIIVGITTTVVPAAAATIATEIRYDMNSDGIVNVFDFVIIKREIISGNSEYNVSDVVRMKKFLLGEIEIGKPIKRDFYSKIEVNEENSNILVNAICSDDETRVRLASEGTDFVVSAESSSIIQEFEFTELAKFIPNYATVICSFTTDDGSKYVVYTDDNNKYILSEDKRVGTAISGYLISDCEQSTLQNIEKIFSENQLVSVTNDSNGNIEFSLVDSVDKTETEISVEFKADVLATHEMSDSMLLQKELATDTSIVYTLYSNGTNYSITAIG